MKQIIVLDYPDPNNEKSLHTTVIDYDKLDKIKQSLINFVLSGMETKDIKIISEDDIRKLLEENGFEPNDNNVMKLYLMKLIWFTEKYFNLDFKMMEE